MTDFIMGAAVGVVFLFALFILLTILGAAARVIGYGFRKGWLRAAPRTRVVNIPPRPFLPTSDATHLQFKGTTFPHYPPITQEPIRTGHRYDVTDMT